MDNLPVSSTKGPGATALHPAAPREYLFTYSWPRSSPPITVIVAGWVVLLVCLVTPTILSPGIERRAARERPLIELPSAATFLEQIPQLSPDTAQQRAVLPENIRDLQPADYGIARLMAENSLRAYTYRFAIRRFTPNTDQSWLQLFLWIAQPALLLKGALIVLVLLAPAMFLRTRIVSSPNRDSLPILSLAIEAGLSPLTSVAGIAFHVAWAAAIVGFVSELLALLYWSLLTALPYSAVLFGLLFDFCGILPYILVAIQVWYLFAFARSDWISKGSPDFEWSTVVSKVDSKSSGRAAALLWKGLIATSYGFGLATSIIVLVVGPRCFTQIAWYIAEFCDAHEITYQPAVTVTMLFFTVLALRRFLPPEFKHLNYRLRQAIQLTRSTIRVRQPQAKTLWHTCSAARLPNGSSLVSVQTLREKTEPVFLIWDGEDIACYVGPRQRDANDYRNRTWVPVSKEALSDLSKSLGDLTSTGLQRALSAAANMREAGRPLVPALESLLTTGSSDVRSEVCYTLGHIGGQVAIHALGKCLTDPEPKVRCSAVLGLERLNLPLDQLVILLLPLKEDGDSALATRVNQILADANARA